MNILAAIFISLVTLLASAPSQAEIYASSQQTIVKATLVTERPTISLDKPFEVAIILEPQPGWHTYWENPGDAGMATTMIWTLPEGFTASGIDWPLPERIQEGSLVTYAYNENIFLPVTITPPSTKIFMTSYPIKVKATWLVCRDVCIPESADLEISLPRTDPSAMLDQTKPEATTGFTAMFEAHRQLQPQHMDGPLGYHIVDNKLSMWLPLEAMKVKDVSAAVFFPREQNIFKYSSEQKLDLSNKEWPQLIVDVMQTPSKPVSGLLSIVTSDNVGRYFDITLIPAHAPVVPGSIGSGATSDLSLPIVLLLAIMGGLVLNLMPCVLPVLSLKALAIAKKSGKAHEHVVQQGIAYTLGIMISFGIIAGLLLTLRQAGQSIGWGYQMQYPAFVGFLMYLLFMVGLSLSGVFHLPVLLGSVGSDIANESSARGSFFTGVLATAVATPCTAPFMAGAVGAALTMPTWQALLVFEALGFGLALPFLTISLFPRLRRFLPKPGAWMETFKQLLAFPMYASVIWLMWVLAMQAGPDSVILSLTGMLVIVIAIWMKRLFADDSALYRLCAIVIYALVLFISLPMLNSMEIATAALPGNHAEHGINTMAYSKEKLADLRKAGKPVFVDATAAWCITCQINARVAIHTDKVMHEFKKRGITLMIADWTRRNDDITEFLSGFGHKGVPLCVFYPAGDGKNTKEPVVLPQILTEDIVLKIITGE